MYIEKPVLWEAALPGSQSASQTRHFTWDQKRCWKSTVPLPSLMLKKTDFPSPEIVLFFNYFFFFNCVFWCKLCCTKAGEPGAYRRTLPQSWGSEDSPWSIILEQHSESVENWKTKPGHCALFLQEEMLCIKCTLPIHPGDFQVQKSCSRRDSPSLKLRLDILSLASLITLCETHTSSTPC